MYRREFLKYVTYLTLSNSHEKVLEGDLLLTRNAGGDEANRSPGYYNHSAIIGPMNWVIESQAIPNAVIAVPIWNFFERYPEILVLRNIDSKVAKATAEIAPKYVGRKYAQYISVRPLWLWKNKDSCISLLRRIYNAVDGVDYKWRIPDSLLKEHWLHKVALKKDYENYKKPIDPYKGMVKSWTNQQASQIKN